MARRRGDGGHVLVVRITNPRECAEDADSDGEVCDDAHYQNSIVIVLVVDEDERYPEDQPYEARCCAARVNASQVLQDGRAP